MILRSPFCFRGWFGFIDVGEIIDLPHDRAAAILFWEDFADVKTLGIVFGLSVCGYVGLVREIGDLPYDVISHPNRKIQSLPL